MNKKRITKNVALSAPLPNPLQCNPSQIFDTAAILSEASVTAHRLSDLSTGLSLEPRQAKFGKFGQDFESTYYSKAMRPLCTSSQSIVTQRHTKEKSSG